MQPSYNVGLDSRWFRFEKDEGRSPPSSPSCPPSATSRARCSFLGDRDSEALPALDDGRLIFGLRERISSTAIRDVPAVCHHLLGDGHRRCFPPIGGILVWFCSFIFLLATAAWLYGRMKGVELIDFWIYQHSRHPNIWASLYGITGSWCTLW